MTKLERISYWLLLIVGITGTIFGIASLAYELYVGGAIYGMRQR